MLRADVSISRRAVTLAAASLLAASGGVSASPRPPVRLGTPAAEPAPQLVAAAGSTGLQIGALFTPDGRFVVTYGTTIVVVWTRSGQEVRRFSLPGDRRLVGIGSDRLLIRRDASTFSLYALSTGAHLRDLVLDGGDTVKRIAFLGDDGTIVGLGGDTVRIWDAATGRLVRSFTCTDAVSSGLTASRDGALIATFGGGRRSRTSLDADFAFVDTTVTVWDAATGRRRAVFHGHDRAVTEVAFSPDGTLAASASVDGTVRIWSTSSGDEVRRLRPSADVKPADSLRPPSVSDVSFSPDGRSVATCTRVGSQFDVCLWNVATGESASVRSRIRNLGGGSHSVAPHESVSYFSAEFAPDARELLVTGLASDSIVVDAVSGRTLVELDEFALPSARLAFSTDGSTLTACYPATSPEQAVTDQTSAACAWSLKTGSEAQRFRATRADDTGVGVWLSRDSAYLALEQWALDANHELSWTTKLLRANTRSELWSNDAQFLRLSPDERLVLERPRRGNSIALLDAATGAVVHEFDHVPNFSQHAFSPDSRFVAFAMNDDDDQADHLLRIMDTTSGELVSAIDLGKGTSFGPFAFSPDGRSIVVGGNDPVSFSLDRKGTIRKGAESAVRLFDVASGKLLRTLETLHDRVSFVAFSPNGRTVLVPETASNDLSEPRVELLDVATGRSIATLRGHRSSIADGCFSPDGRLVATSSSDGTIRLWHSDSGLEVCQLISFVDGTWVTVAPDGRFDTNNLETVTLLHWILPDAPSTPVPFEAFMRDYFEPGLLPRLLAGESFPPVAPVASLNRLQPRIRISGVRRDPAGSDTVTVVVDVESTRGTSPTSGRATESGVRDVRLFRDGQLVGSAPHEGGPVRVDPSTRRGSVAFSGVRLPRVAGVSTATFSAYAFNDDGVKSVTDVQTARIPSDLTPRKGRAYVVSIGINAYDDPRLELRFAANDARFVQSSLPARVGRTGRYEDVVPIALLSERDGAHDATKARIRAVFDVLAGRHPAPDLFANVANADRLRPARPEDLVIVTYSGHGYADRHGGFFLIPSDFGADAAGVAAPSGGRKLELAASRPDGAADLLATAISSDDLAAWLRDVDAGDMALVIDACQSAAFTGENFKPGPMGNRGLGQLAFDKGMLVLAAAQADNVALESKKLRQGLLTYALVTEGLEAGDADSAPHDGSVTLDEWLAFAERRVPTLAAEIRSDGGRMVVLEGAAPPGAAAAAIQQPTLFDFTKRRRDVVLSNGTN